jgi:hypothetical protein
MKRYNHTTTIRLGKPNTMYCSRIDGTIIYINSVSWFRDKQTGHKCCVIRRSNDDKRLYTSEEFHEEFNEFISREEELIKETTKAFTQRIIDAMDAASANKKPKNQNGRIYSGTEFANYIADRIANVGTALSDLGDEFASKKNNVYSDGEYAIAMKKPRLNLFTYDIVADPGFNSATVSKPTKLKIGPFYG